MNSNHDWTLRPMQENDDDLGVYAELDSLHANEPSTLDMVKDREKTFPKDGVKYRVFAQARERVLGMVAAYRWPNDRPGVFWGNVVIRHEERGRGVGRDLWEDLDRFLVAEGCTEIRCFVRDRDSASQEFAQRRGFTVRQHIFESTIIPSEFDASVHPAPQPENVTIAPYSDLQGQDGALERLWKLSIRLEADIPGVDPGTERSLEQFELEFTKAYTWDPSSVFVALDGEQWVGLGWVIQLNPGRYYNILTGVDRSHRGRGIAKALKLRTVEFAQNAGAEYIRTNNDSSNAAMLAINQSMGYRPEPGWYILEKKDYAA